MTNNPDVFVNWSMPAGRPDWLMGAGATTDERAVVWVTAAVATAAVGLSATLQGVAWLWWQWLLVVVLTVDVAGGVPANALGSAKRFYHSPVPPGSPLPRRLLHHHVGFAALHVHPFVVAALIYDATVWWALCTYAIVLVGTVAVVAAPLYLRRSLAFAIVTVAVIAEPAVDAPAGLAWFGPVLALKLVAAHAVREEPYRPAPRGL